MDSAAGLRSLTGKFRFGICVRSPQEASIFRIQQLIEFFVQGSKLDPVIVGLE